jgi:hypothetical protein
VKFSKSAARVLSTLTGSVSALFTGSRRRAERAHALERRVQVQDWESAPLKGTVPGAKVPTPEEVAKEITGAPATR